MEGECLKHIAISEISRYCMYGNGTVSYKSVSKIRFCPQYPDVWLCGIHHAAGYWLMQTVSRICQCSGDTCSCYRPTSNILGSAGNSALHSVSMVTRIM